ncbi:fluoride efflux transporter CrcB [Alcaligenaceae bacterium]|nr:fluoride efflux transporter CrcB [Alcaligenaceae bacterium]
MLTFGHFLAVGMGAAIGAVLRWLLGLWLNTAHALLPWGTLAANLVGGYLIGLILALLLQSPEVPAWLRLFLITGFLGGLTTFSTFSSEVYSFLERGAFLEALLYAGASLLGSLLLTAAGFATVHGLKG